MNEQIMRLDRKRFEQLNDIGKDRLPSVLLDQMFDSDNSPYDYMEPFDKYAVVEIWCENDTLYMLLDIDGYNHGIGARRIERC
tara:strand:+ start:1693 stop:1941 length:249 start_codon:yes stop_codon:yes gene_type:complete